MRGVPIPNMSTSAIINRLTKAREESEVVRSAMLLPEGRTPIEHSLNDVAYLLEERRRMLNALKRYAPTGVAESFEDHE